MRSSWGLSLRASGQALSGVEGLSEITLALFVEAVDDASRARYETLYADAANGVTVIPAFVATG